MRALKIIAAAAAVLAALAAGAAALAAWMGERKMQRIVDIRVVPVPFTRDPAAVALGRYLFESRGCGECHGADGGGRVMINDPHGLYVKTPNITAGTGGVVTGYTEADWVRAIRHGVSPRGHALLIMPCENYNRLNDGDFAAIVAFTRSLAPVAGGGALVRMPLAVKALYGAGAIRDASEKIDHRRPPPAPVAVGPSVEHGGYVANMCLGCHGATLAGGRIAGTPPDWPPAANLTSGPGSVMPRYDTAEKFISMMRSGKRPDGSEVSKAMPFASLRKLNDVDLNAMYAYLASVAPGNAGVAR